MGERVKRGQPKPVDEVLMRAMIDADIFINAGRERNAAAKLYDAAKAGLKAWLGTDLSRSLPDGRTVTLSITPRTGYKVEDGTTAVLTVSAPPAAA